MVGESKSWDSQEATHLDSTQDCGTKRTIFGTTDGTAIARLDRLNKAVPAIPYEFRGGGNVFHCL